MSWEIIFKIVGATLFSVGGASVIIFGVANWLGKIWANRILESEKAKYSREMEKLKSEFSKDLECYKKQLELSKLALSRYSENQFNLYNKLWNSLCDLKFAGDKLWNNTTADNLVDFAVKLQEAGTELLRNALLIEDEHSRQLKELLDKFGNYQVGKVRLIQINIERKKNPSLMTDLGHALVTHSITDQNASTKRDYEALLMSIKDSFKGQLKKGI